METGKPHQPKNPSDSPEISVPQNPQALHVFTTVVRERKELLKKNSELQEELRLEQERGAVLKAQLEVVREENKNLTLKVSRLNGTVRALENILRESEAELEELLLTQKSHSGKDLISQARVSRLQQDVDKLKKALAETYDLLEQERNKSSEGVSPDHQVTVPDKVHTTHHKPFRSSFLSRARKSLRDMKRSEDSKVESVEERAQATRERLKDSIPEKVAEFYKKNSFKINLAFSATLIGVSMIGTGFALPAVEMAARGARVALRGYGAYRAGKTVEKKIRSTMVTGLKEGGSLSQKQLDSLRQYKFLTMFSAFCLGSAFEIKDIASDFSTALDHLPQVDVLPEVTLSHPPTPEVVTKIIPGISEPIQFPQPEVPPVPIPASPLDAVLYSPEPLVTVAVTKGDHLGSLIGKNISYLLPQELLTQLSPNGKINYIGNILKKLTPDQLEAIGVTSRDVDAIKETDVINITKLKEIVSTFNIRVKGGGGFMSLFERARIE